MKPVLNPAIDMAHLATYTQGDRALELELLAMFLPSAQGYIDAMADGNTAGDGEAWWQAAHSLKGVALGVGATELAGLAEIAEGHRDGAYDIRADDVAALQSAMKRVRSFVAALN